MTFKVCNSDNFEYKKTGTSGTLLWCSPDVYWRCESHGHIFFPIFFIYNGCRAIFVLTWFCHSSTMYLHGFAIRQLCTYMVLPFVMLYIHGFAIREIHGICVFLPIGVNFLGQIVWILQFRNTDHYFPDSPANFSRKIEKYYLYQFCTWNRKMSMNSRKLFLFYKIMIALFQDYLILNCLEYSSV